MILLIDTVSATSPGGIQLRDEILKSVEERRPDNCQVIILVSKPLNGLDKSAGLKVINIQRQTLGWISQWKWYNSMLPRIAREQNADVVYSFFGILLSRVHNRFATITSVVTMLPFTPQKYSTYPLISKMHLRNIIQRRLLVKGLRMTDAAVFHARHTLDTVTPYTGDISGKTLVELTGVPRDLQFDFQNPPPHPYDDRPFLLYLSAIYPYKNHLRLIEAYRKALETKDDIPDLLIGGITGNADYLAKIESAIGQVKPRGKAKFLGKLPRRDIPAWLHHADFNLFPSLCENNSVVLAEILGVGGVLACSKYPPMSEVGGEACEIFDPYSIDSMKETILKLSCDSNRLMQLRQSALKRAEELSWNACGDAVWKAASNAREAFNRRTGNAA